MITNTVAVGSPVVSPARSPAPAPVAAPRPAANGAMLAQAVEAANKAVRSLSNGLEFSVDLASGKTVVRVIDGVTGRLIRQIPSEEMLAIARALDRLQGLLLDSTA